MSKVTGQRQSAASGQPSHSRKSPRDPLPAARARFWLRVAFAGPGAIVTALTVMAGMSLWFPGGAAGIDNLVLPLVLAPLIWAALFFHACLDSRLARVVIVALTLLAIHGGLIAAKFLGALPVTEVSG